MPLTPGQLLENLKSLGILYVNHCHDPVMTVDESQALRGQIEGLHSKNLFLKDKKGGLWLVVAEETCAIDLKNLRKRLGVQSLSFGKPDLLMQTLGVAPGSVTPFCVINDRQSEVQLVLDETLANAPIVNFHPLDNSQTTTISGQDLLRFVRSHQHEPVILSFNSNKT